MYLLVFFPLLAAPLVYLLGRRSETARDRAAIVVMCAEFVLSLYVAKWGIRSNPFPFLHGKASAAFPAADFSIILGLHFQADGFRVVYGVIAALMWLGTTLFAQEYFRHEREGLDGYWFFTLLTLGATEGVMFSSDFLTAFTFFEILSLTSFTWVIHERTEGAVRAGYTYLFIAVGGGMVLFMGLLLVKHICGTLAFNSLVTCVRMTGLDGLGGTDGFSAANGPWPAVADELAEAAGTVSPLFPAGLCILAGFGAKAGMFPLHVWLPMAHPVAPSPASALLSGILTKVGVYGVLMTALSLLYRDFAFGMVLLCLGLVTMFLGAALALFSVNLKRTLACSSMSQIGFIFIGIGCTVLGRTFGSDAAADIALSGTMLHMVNHSLFKLVLFLAAGAVVMNLHTLTLDDIRGWGRNKPLLKLCFALGGLGISGVPLLNGYLSKTLLHEGILHVLEAVREARWKGIVSAVRPLTGALALAQGSGLTTFLHVAEWVFLISGGCTFAYMLKLFFCVFVEKNADPSVQARYNADARCMDRLSSGTLLSCSLLLIPLGQPALSLWLARRMTGASIHFEAFAWENLQGGLISLSIGAAVYLLLVRPVLRPHGQYVNRWPAVLDLERVVYRGFLAGAVPAGLGAAAQCLADNTVLRPLSAALLSFGSRLAGTLADNRVLYPLCRFLVFFGTLLGRTLSDSVDALAVLLRRTAVLREVRRRDETDARRVSRVQAFRQASGDTLETFFESFSFALLMACVGIILIFTLLAVML